MIKKIIYTRCFDRRVIFNVSIYVTKVNISLNVKIFDVSLFICLQHLCFKQYIHQNIFSGRVLLEMGNFRHFVFLEWGWELWVGTRIVMNDPFPDVICNSKNDFEIVKLRAFQPIYKNFRLSNFFQP